MNATILKNRAKRHSSQQADDTAKNGDSSNGPLFQREDWTLFRNLSTLGQKAGVHQEAIPRLILKELADNALDETGTCRFGETEDGWLYVEDDGEGLPGSDSDIASLFSVSRPLTSSKLLRRPSRGALGNGLRVVAGAVLASDGQMVVKTRGRKLRLRPRDCDGGTDVENLEPWDGRGTRVEVLLGDSLPVEEDTFEWAYRAIRLTRGETYKGRTSPWWYDSDSFYELTQAADRQTVRELVAGFEGCSGAKAGKLAAAFSGRPCASLSREEVEELLSKMRDASGQVKAERLGALGPQLCPDAGYSREVGEFEVEAARGRLPAQILYVVEVWASEAEEPQIDFHINRTPITAEVGMSRCFKDKTQYGLSGCGLSDEHHRTALPIKAGKDREFWIVVNVTTPHMPITTDGKAPDLLVIEGPLQIAAEKAIRQAKRRQPANGRQTTQREIIVDSLPAAIAKASGEGQYRYSLRQLFYAVRPSVLSELGIELNYGYFGKVVTEYEAANGCDVPGMYRDGDYDLAGFAVGAVERGELLSGENVAAGDVVLGLASTGIHSNGFSLVRRIVEDFKLDYAAPAPFAADQSLAEALLTPTRIYVKSCLAAIAEGGVNGLCHVTGGGILENLPRVMANGTRAVIDTGAWQAPAVFPWLTGLGGMADEEMARTFNCGIGMIVVTEADAAKAVSACLADQGESVFEIGRIEASGGDDAPEVQLTNLEKAAWRG